MRIAFSILLLCLFLNLSSQTFTLHVKVSCLTKCSGHLHVGIFDDQQKFLTKGMEYDKIKVPAGDSVIYLEFQLEPGIYAISMFHDMNGDGMCNKNKLGIPTEPYGFSNNIRPKIPKPSFKRASFEVRHDTCLNIRLHQPKRASK